MALFAAPALARPTPDESAAVIEAEARGTELFAYDQAAWHATDQFQADIAAAGISLQALESQGLQGYIVEPSDRGSLSVTFYGKRDERLFAFARYSVVETKVADGGILADGADTTVSDVAQRMIAARSAAIELMTKPDHGLCSETPANTLILPPRADGTISAYVLTSTTSNDEYPAGGHYRFDFDSAGRPTGERRFMKSCFPLNFRQQGDARPEMIFVTHLLDPQPTEIHAFVSRNIPVALMVGTIANKKIWGLTRGHIEYVRDFPDK
ncbi:MAG TPA: hypothetical protein VM055_02855 [Novosphingobium sp.]|nr:hypothetical protein [Novosphingobium sp.]